MCQSIRQSVFLNLSTPQMLVSLLSMGASIYLAYMVMQQLDPTKASRKQIAFARKQLQRRLGRDISLSNTETVRLCPCPRRPAHRRSQ